MAGKIQTNYYSILHKETAQIFFDRFIGVLNKNLEKFYGEEEARRVLTCLGTKKLRIISPENFLYSPLNISDNSLELYNTCKSMDEFFYKSLMNFKKRAEGGETDIEVREFFFALIDYISTHKDTILEEDINKYTKTLLATFINVRHPSPFIIRILEPHLRPLIEEKTGLNMAGYGKFIRSFFKAFKELTLKPDPILEKTLYFPRIEVIYPVYEDIKSNQEQYLASLFAVEKSHIKSIFKDCDSLSEDSPTLRTAFNIIMAETGKTFNTESILLELQRIKSLKPFKTYPTLREFSEIYRQNGIPKSLFSDTRIKKISTNLELFENCLRPYFCEIEIDCKSLSQRGISSYIDAAKTLSMFKTHYYRYVKKAYNSKRKLNFKITLRNVKELSQDFVKFVKRKQRQIRSSSGKQFFIEIVYNNEVATRKLGKTNTSCIRVISDIHADYNKQNNYTFNFGDDFVINCGDTGANSNTCVTWNRNHIKQGVIVAGNHLGYAPDEPELGMYDTRNTKSFQLHRLGVNLTGVDGPLFLSNSVTQYEGIVILGTTLYTDFALYGESYIEQAMQYAKQGMNDFRYITVPGHREYERVPGGWKVTKTKKGEGTVRLFTPQDHAYYFHYSLNFLKEKVLEYSHKPIIIVTHHAPSPYSIAPEYEGSMLNPAFASNLNDFILQHPQIRLWCHGHVHNIFDYILGETRVVCYPFGYNNENDADIPFKYGLRIPIKDIKDKKKSWKEICKEEIEWGLVKVYEK